MLGLEDVLQTDQQFFAQHAKFRPAVVNGGQADGAQDAVWHRAGTGDLQEVAAGGVLVELHLGCSVGCAAGLCCAVHCSDSGAKISFAYKIRLSMLIGL